MGSNPTPGILVVLVLVLVTTALPMGVIYEGESLPPPSYLPPSLPCQPRQTRMRVDGHWVPHGLQHPGVVYGVSKRPGSRQVNAHLLSIAFQDSALPLSLSEGRLVRTVEELVGTIPSSESPPFLRKSLGQEFGFQGLRQRGEDVLHSAAQ